MSLQQAATSAIVAPPNLAVETTVASLAGIDLSAGQLVIAEAMFDLTPGAGTTSVTARCRLVTPGGTLVVGAGVVLNLVAGVRDTRTVQWAFNVPAEAAGDQFNLTLLQAAATANGVLNAVMLGITA